MNVQFTCRMLPIRSLASGTMLSVPIYHFVGDPTGKKVYIQANIHGPEIAGIGAAYELIPLLRQQPGINGSITVIPCINPVGLNYKINDAQVGYADSNEYTVGNFNRIYQLLVTNREDEDADKEADPNAVPKVVLEDFVAAHMAADIATIETDFKQALMDTLANLKAKKGENGLRFGLHLAILIQEMMQDADYVIDLHTGDRATYYGYTFDVCLDAYKYFHLPYVIELADESEGVFDEIFLLPWIRLQKAFAKAGREIPWHELDKEAFTPEFGSLDTLDKFSAEEDARRIINYLRHKKVLPGEPEPPLTTVAKCQHKHLDKYYAPVGGVLYWHKQPGDHVAKGEQFATLLQLGNAENMGNSIQIPISANVEGVLVTCNRSQVLHQGLSICSIMSHLENV